MSVSRLFALNVIDMYLVKMNVKDAGVIHQFFRIYKEVEDYINSFPSHLIIDFSVHPLYVEEPIMTKSDLPKKCYLTSTIFFDDQSYKKVLSIHPKNFYDLVINHYDLKHVTKIQISVDKY